MKTVTAVLAAGVALIVMTGTTLGSEHERREGTGYERHKRYESKRYGTVDKIPGAGLGIWIINGKEVLVTKDTFIKEEHGKAAVGAYVEVTGGTDGKTFHASEIEIKRARQ